MRLTYVALSVAHQSISQLFIWVMSQPLTRTTGMVGVVEWQLTLFGAVSHMPTLGQASFLMIFFRECKYCSCADVNVVRTVKEVMLGRFSRITTRTFWVRG